MNRVASFNWHVNCIFLILSISTYQWLISMYIDKNGLWKYDLYSDLRCSRIYLHFASLVKEYHKKIKHVCLVSCINYTCMHMSWVLFWNTEPNKIKKKYTVIRICDQNVWSEQEWAIHPLFCFFIWLSKCNKTNH